MPFYPFLFQNHILPELCDWIIFTGWAAVLLLLTVLAFFLPGISRAKSAWWQYLALLLIAGLGVWSIVVAYTGYQQWLHFHTLLRPHGLYAGFYFVRTPYLAVLRACQFQFALLASILIVLLGVAGWQLLRILINKVDRERAVDNHHGYLWMSSVLFVIGFCCLAVGVFLISKLNVPFYAPQDYQFERLTALELIGLFTVSLGGPLILLLPGVTNIVRHMYPGYHQHSAESRSR